LYRRSNSTLSFISGFDAPQINVKNPRLYTPHCVVAFIAMSLPLLLSFVRNENKPNLTGIVISDKKPELESSSWFSGSYQASLDDYNEDHWALKEICVRLNNQLYYDAFNQIRVSGFVNGKENYVFSENYIYSAFGDDLMKESAVSELLEKAKILQDTLARKGIDLLLVYAPGKGMGCREFIEDKYIHPVGVTNHELFMRHTRRLGINHLDLYDWFGKLKSTSPYPLFPKFGHHWSYFGECMACDTLISHIEDLSRTDMPDITWENIDVVDSARSRDADVLKSMNLWKNPPQHMKLAYPEILFESDSLKNTTRVLTVSDSYWYGPVYMGIPQNCFAGGQFWYYFNKVIPSPRPGEKVEVWELDLKKEIESNRVIMLLYSDGNLPTFGSGFIQNAYEMYTSPGIYSARMEKEKQVQYYAKEIRQSPVLLKKSTVKSTELGISLDSSIRYDAARMAGLVK
jgi:hypothetical protein